MIRPYPDRRRTRGGLPRLLAGLVTSIALSWSSASTAQLCSAEWQPGTVGELPGVLSGSGASFALQVFDDGTGDALFLAGALGGAGATDAEGVARWDGDRWGETSPLSWVCRSLTVHDDGRGAALWAGRDGFGPSVCVRRWSGTDWEAVAPGMVGRPNAMISWDDGSGPALYVGGALSRVAGGPPVHLARWDGSTWTVVGGDTDQPVEALAVADLGAGPVLVVGGQFREAGGLPTGRVAAWDGSSWSSLEPPDPTVGGVLALEVLAGAGGDSVVAAGEFTSIGGVAANRIAVLDGGTWAPLGSGTDDRIETVLVVGDDVYVGGDFTAAGGVSASRVAVWRPTGGWEALGSGLDDECRTLALFDDGGGPDLYAAGPFRVAGGHAVACVARWDGVDWSRLGTGFDLPVLCSTIVGGTLLVGGGFGTVADLDTPRVASWDGTTWSGFPPGGPTQPVTSIAAFEGASGLEVFAASWGGLRIHRLAGGTWVEVQPSGFLARDLAVLPTPTGPRLFAGGRAGAGSSVGNIVRWTGSGWVTVGAGLLGSGSFLDGVYDLHVFETDAGPRLVAGGSFVEPAAPLTASLNISMLDGSSWEPLGAGASTTVRSMTSFDDGTGPKLYAVGTFANLVGPTVGPVAVWTGTQWQDLPGVAPSAVGRLTAHADGGTRMLYAHGTADSLPTTPGQLWRHDGAAWEAVTGPLPSWVERLQSFDPGTGPELVAFLREPVGLGAPPDSYLQRWRTCTQTWEDLGGGSPGAAGTPSLSPSGSLAGGTTLTLALDDVPRDAALLGWVAFASSPFPALGGVVHAYPFSGQYPTVADPNGAWNGAAKWPTGVPPGTSLWVQFVVEDPTVPAGLTLSNALAGTTP